MDTLQGEHACMLPVACTVCIQTQSHWALAPTLKHFTHVQQFEPGIQLETLQPFLLMPLPFSAHFPV